MTTRLPSISLSCVLMVSLTTTWPSAEAPHHIGPNTANPSYIVVNTATPVTFASVIVDSSLKKHDPKKVLLIRTDVSGTPIDILGRMNDRGRKVDSTKNDHTYTLQTTLNEPSAGQAQFRIAAKFRQQLERDADGDDDWDGDLARCGAIKNKQERQGRLTTLLRRLTRYSLSDPIIVRVSLPAIQWSTTAIEVTLSPGNSSTQTLALTSDGNIKNTSLDVDPVLRPFITINPISLPTVIANQPQMIALSLSPSVGSAFGTYDGTIRATNDSISAPAALKIRINVWRTHTDTASAASLQVPPTWDATTNLGTRLQEKQLCGGPGDGPNSFAPLGSGMTRLLGIYDSEIAFTAHGAILFKIRILRVPASGQIALCELGGSVFDANVERASAEPPPYYEFFDASDEIDARQPVYILRKHLLYQGDARVEAIAMSSLDTESLERVGCNWSPDVSRESCARQYFESDTGAASLRSAFDEAATSINTLIAR